MRPQISAAFLVLPMSTPARRNVKRTSRKLFVSLIDSIAYATRRIDTPQKFCLRLTGTDRIGTQASSNSIKVPQKSRGCRKRTGLPCAPVLGSPSPSTVAPCTFSVSRAAMMSSTS